MQAAELEAAHVVRSGTLAHPLPGERYPPLAYATPRAAMVAWMASAGHRANILSASYGETGAAVSRARDGSLVWVQVFAAPR